MHSDGTLCGVTDKQWPDKTLDISGLRPDATGEPTAAVPTGTAFQPGVAQVGARSTLRLEGESTSTDITDIAGSAIQSRPGLKQPQIPLRSRLRQLRRGGRWSAIGAAVLVVSWGIWAISGRDGDTAVAALALLITFGVGGFLFGLSRLLGYIVLERTLNRVRKTAWVAHAVIGLFFALAGLAYLRRVDWIVDSWEWLRGR